MKIKIRTKLLVIIFSIIVVNYVIILFFGNSFIETFYKSKKEEELINYGTSIKKSFYDETPWVNVVVSGEQRNMTFLIFDYNNTTAEEKLLYFSGKEDDNRPNYYKYWISESISNGVFVSLDLSPETLFSIEEKNSLNLYMLLDENRYLFIQTPLDYISTTADLAIEFFLYLSLASLAIGFVMIYITSMQISKPIVTISAITKRIASLQFDQKCAEKGNDEISDLAKSVNQMAAQIEQNIDILMEKNQLLKKDLQREAKTSELRRQFIANVSHDFKTPLSLIQAYTEVLKESAHDVETKETYSIIIEQVRQMNMLVNQLLSLSQLESGLVILNTTFFSLQEVIENVVRNLDILLKEREINCLLNVQQDEIVVGDYQRIIQVCTNLLENAVKYTPNKAKIEIEVKAQDQQITTRFINPAPSNMSEEKLEHLFDSFYKMDDSRGLANKSYGLGLSIVKAIMDLHAQKCSAHLEEDNIVFCFTLQRYQFDNSKEQKEGE